MSLGFGIRTRKRVSILIFTPSSVLERRTEQRNRRGRPWGVKNPAGWWPETAEENHRRWTRPAAAMPCPGLGRQQWAAARPWAPGMLAAMAGACSRSSARAELGTASSALWWRRRGGCDGSAWLGLRRGGAPGCGGSRASAHAASRGEKETEDEEGEWEWRGQGACPLLKHGSSEGSKGTAGGSGGSKGEARGANSQQHGDGDDTVHKIQISNSTSNVPLKLIFRASVTPKPRRVSKNFINKSCRSTRHLQLFLKRQSLIRPGWRDTRLQRRVNENWNLSFSPLRT